MAITRGIGEATAVHPVNQRVYAYSDFRKGVESLAAGY